MLLLQIQAEPADQRRGRRHIGLFLLKTFLHRLAKRCIIQGGARLNHIKIDLPDYGPIPFNLLLKFCVILFQPWSQPAIRREGLKIRRVYHYFCIQRQVHLIVIMQTKPQRHFPAPHIQILI